MMVKTIVDAGFVSLTRYGLEGTTTRHIADIAGISPGTLYQYYRDKNAVYHAMGERFTDDLIAWTQELWPQIVQKEVGEAVEALLLALRDWLGRDDGRYLQFLRYLGELDLADNMARTERALLALASQYFIRHPELVRLNLENIPVMLYIVINGGAATLVRYLATPSPYLSFDQLVTGLSCMVRAYVTETLLRQQAPGDLRKI